MDYIRIGICDDTVMISRQALNHRLGMMLCASLEENVGEALSFVLAFLQGLLSTRLGRLASSLQE